MGFRKIEECEKGDICSFEICVERSLPNKDGVTITLWKREDDRFQVSKGLEKLRRYEIGEAEARKVYENYCDDNGYLPYPQAKEYFERKGLLKEPVE